MSQGGWRSQKWDCVRLVAFVLTPQCFSTSSLVFGPVLIHPRKYYTPRLSKVKGILLMEMPTNDAKVRERDFVYFVSFVGKLGLTKNFFLFLPRLFYSKNDRQHLIYLFYKYEVHLLFGIFRHFNQVFFVSFW